MLHQTAQLQSGLLFSWAKSPDICHHDSYLSFPKRAPSAHPTSYIKTTESDSAPKICVCNSNQSFWLVSWWCTENLIRWGTGVHLFHDLRGSELKNLWSSSLSHDSPYPRPHLLLAVSDTSCSALYAICQTKLLMLIECQMNCCVINCGGGGGERGDHQMIIEAGGTKWEFAPHHTTPGEFNI